MAFDDGRAASVPASPRPCDSSGHSQSAPESHLQVVVVDVRHAPNQHTTAYGVHNSTDASSRKRGSISAWPGDGREGEARLTRRVSQLFPCPHTRLEQRRRHLLPLPVQRLLHRHLLPHSKCTSTSAQPHKPLIVGTTQSYYGS